jgi:hypothetical protein
MSPLLHHWLSASLAAPPAGTCMQQGVVRACAWRLHLHASLQATLLPATLYSLQATPKVCLGGVPRVWPSQTFRVTSRCQYHLAQAPPACLASSHTARSLPAPATPRARGPSQAKPARPAYKRLAWYGTLLRCIRQASPAAQPPPPPAPPSLCMWRRGGWLWTDSACLRRAVGPRASTCTVQGDVGMNHKSVIQLHSEEQNASTGNRFGLPPRTHVPLHVPSHVSPSPRTWRAPRRAQS